MILSVITITLAAVILSVDNVTMLIFQAGQKKNAKKQAVTSRSMEFLLLATFQDFIAGTSLTTTVTAIYQYQWTAARADC